MRINGRINPRLALQEATLRRESVRAMLPAEKLKLLEEADGVLAETLSTIELQQNPGLRSQVLAELASCYRFKIRAFASINDIEHARRAFYSAVNYAEQSALGNPTNVHAADIMAWSSLDASKEGILSDVERAEALTNAVASLSNAMPTTERAERQLLERLLGLAKELDNSKLVSKTFNALKQKGSAAGYYLTAIDQLGTDLLQAVILGQEKELDDDDLENCRKTLEYLESHEEAVLKDSRAGYLMLRLWWIVRTGRSFLRHEHLRVAFTESDWHRLLAWCRAITQSNNGQIIVPIRFVEAVAHFHLGQPHECEDAFADIRNTDDRGRIRLRIIASRSDGSRIVIDDGIVSRMMYLPGAVRPRAEKSFVRFNWNGGLFEIPFRAREFFKSDITEGDTLGPFVVGFNFIGPLAFPRHHRNQM